MATFIKAGFWEKLCQKCTGYRGWLNLDELIQSLAPPAPEPAYKVYTAAVTFNNDTEELLNLNVLENTLGGSLTFVLTGNNSEFTITSSGLFTLYKTFVLMNSPFDAVGSWATIDSINQLTVNFDSYGNNTGNDAEYIGFIEVRVYP